MALTKATYAMIANGYVNALDFMSAAQVEDVRKNIGSIDVSAALQAAVNSIENDAAIPNGTLYLPAGTYLLGSEILLIGQIKVLGDGFGATIVKAKDNFALNGRLFDTFRRDNITIEGIYFDGNVANQPNYVPASDNGVSAIIIRSSKNITIKDCYFKNFGKDGVWMFGTLPARTNDQITIDGCVFDTMYRNGFSVIEGQNIVVVNNKFINGKDIANVTLNEGVRIEADANTEYTVNCVIANNTFKDMYGGVGLYNQNLSTIQRNIVISDNVFENITGRAAVFAWRLKDEGCTITNNRFFNCGSSSADPSVGAGGGVCFSESNNVIISGNYFEECGGEFATVAASAGQANSQVVNNTFFKDRRGAIHLISVDIPVGASGTYRLIANNVCRKGGQETANTYTAIKVWGNNPGGGADGGCDIVDANTIETSTTDGYAVGIDMGYDNGQSILGTNVTSGTGVSVVFTSTPPKVEFESAQSGSVASTGALTGAVDYQIRKQFDLVTVELGDLIGTTTNVANITMGVTLPARFRPSSIKYGFCLVQVNGVLQDQPGLIQVDTGGQITVYRDPSQTTWGTAADTGFISAIISYVL